MTAAPLPSGGALGAAAAWLTSIATGLALIGLTIALFFNPLWVSLEQARSNAESYTGWTLAETQAVGADVVREVWLGPGTFAQAADGVPVFNARERSHMDDVRRVVLAFAAVVLAAAAVLLARAWAARRSAVRRARWWRAVSRGAAITAIGASVAGVAFAVFFDQAFTLFHGLFFAAGTWTFDPATERLVQLFPDPFWTETTVVIAVVGLGLTTATWAIARGKAASAQATADLVTRAGSRTSAPAAEAAGPGGSR